MLHTLWSCHFQISYPSIKNCLYNNKKSLFQLETRCNRNDILKKQEKNKDHSFFDE